MHCMHTGSPAATDQHGACPRPAHHTLPCCCCRQYTSKEALWGHFLRGGAYEGRGFRFTCPYDPPKLPT